MTSILTRNALLQAGKVGFHRLSRVFTIQRAQVLLFGLGLLLWPTAAGAVPIFSSGNATITHDADLVDLLSPTNITVVNPLPAFNSMQYSDTINDSTGSSTGDGGLSHFESGSVVGFDAPSGIGVTQTDVDSEQVFSGAASLLIEFTATWNFTTQFGPAITYFINAPISGVVGAGTGGFVQFDVVATATAEDPGTANHTWGGTLYTQNTPGAFSLFTGVEETELGHFFAENKSGTIVGYIEFIARSGTDGASSIHYIGNGIVAPEPSSLLLLGLSLVGLVSYRSRTR